MELLTPQQRSLLRAIGESPLRDEFFLTGGTALAALYLHHRHSLDLGLFTEKPAAIAQVPPTMQEIADRFGLWITFTRTLGTLLEAFTTSPDGERVEFDFAQDPPTGWSQLALIQTWTSGLTTPQILPVTSSRRFSIGLNRRILWTSISLSRSSILLTSWWHSLVAST
jgi:hypothetical protein